MDNTLLASGLGAIVGVILALTGAGGGSLAVPLLVFGLHLPMQQAAPVALVAVGLASGLGAALGLRDGLVRYRAAALIGLTGMALAPLGVWLAQHLPTAPLMLMFSGVMGQSAWRMWRALRSDAAPTPAGEEPQLPQERRPCRINPDEGRLTWTRPCARALAGIGMLSGLLSGLLGVGGGFVIVPALTRHTDISPRSIAATSLAVIALVSMGGITAAAGHGTFPWRVAVPFGLGAASALLLGRQVAHRLAGRRLQQIFALLCAGVTLAMVTQALLSWANAAPAHGLM